MTHKVLFIIDAQLDFIDGGKLGVKGTKDKMDALAKYICDTKGMYDAIFISVDWHPLTHCSFKENGGVWPVHCEQFSSGAAIYQPILDAINYTGIDYHVFTKGVNEDREEYSVMRNEKSSKEIKTFINTLGIKNVDFCGIADIYCVKDSIEDFHRELPDVKIRALKNFIGFMDEEKFNKFINDNEYIEEIN